LLLEHERRGLVSADRLEHCETVRADERRARLHHLTVMAGRTDTERGFVDLVLVLGRITALRALQGDLAVLDLELALVRAALTGGEPIEHPRLLLAKELAHRLAIDIAPGLVLPDPERAVLLAGDERFVFAVLLLFVLLLVLLLAL